MNFFSLFKRKLIYNFKNKISIDNDGIDNKTLDFLFHHYGSDKADIFKKKKNIGHGYSKFYEDKLKEFKDKNLNILEIGSFAGASAAAFAKYFSNVNIFCFDVNISNFDYISKKIHVFGVDINNEKKVNKNLEKIFKDFHIKNFDIIIDDGSHNLSDILIAIKIFFKHVKPNGLYVIEDFKHPNYYEYNRNVNDVLIDQLLDGLKNKNIVKSNILSINEQKELINFIKEIEIFKGNLIDSDISFITKF